MEWKEEHVKMVGETLKEAIYRVKCVTGKWRWYNPRVMGLVEGLRTSGQKGEAEGFGGNKISN